MRIFRQLLLLMIISSQCVAAAGRSIFNETYSETFLLNCFSSDDLEEEESDTTLSDENSTSSLVHRSVIVNNETAAITVYPGDRLVLNHQSPQSVSRYATDDCTEFSNESLLINTNVYRFHPNDVNKNFTFVCQQDNTTASFGCNYTLAQTFSIQPIPTPRKRSWPIENLHQVGLGEYSLMFLLLMGTLGMTASCMNCCMEWSDRQQEKAADEVAQEMINDNDEHGNDDAAVEENSSMASE
ncbi:unnamed protein product [Cylindrotheca closterium]|uniref:Uncharacterized protein n=1 Tax=Cylindrotheca closterium TaxID=2856 RepID=A0AAD2PXS7_9STRA|nr:unnamed protein product [Cylindrotheca closterium]